MYQIILENKEIIEKTRELIYEIACHKQTREFKSRNGNLTASYLINKEHPDCAILISNLKYLYDSCGIGFKLLSKELGNVSYTRLRTIFKTLEIEKRNGRSCVTESLKAIRSKNASGPLNPWRDWTGKIIDRDKHNKHHLCGWYFNKSCSRFVWLRSSWEYAYAKWLDDKGEIWDVECRSYLLSDGRYYRPDFFIYENNALKKIIEIKSKWSNGQMERIDKFEQFKKEYVGIDAVLFTLDDLQGLGINMVAALKEWKINRKLEKEI